MSGFRVQGVHNQDSVMLSSSLKDCVRGDWRLRSLWYKAAIPSILFSLTCQDPALAMKMTCLLVHMLKMEAPSSVWSLVNEPTRK